VLSAADIGYRQQRRWLPHLLWRSNSTRTNLRPLHTRILISADGPLTLQNSPLKQTCRSAAHCHDPDIHNPAIDDRAPSQAAKCSATPRRSRRGRRVALLLSASCATGPRPRMTQRFDFETSPRISRNSLGPLRRRRFRILRSSSGVNGSISLSSSCAANSSALDAVSRFRRRNGSDAANPSSRSRRIASERELTPLSSAHLSIAAVSLGDNRIAENGSCSEGARSFVFSPGSLGRFIICVGLFFCLSERLATVLGHCDEPTPLVYQPCRAVDFREPGGGAQAFSPDGRRAPRG
jgi:hypothetical protein